MAFEDASNIRSCLRAELVENVKNIQSSCRFGDNLWLGYVAQFGRIKLHEQKYHNVTRNPEEYNDVFLANFLPYVASRAKRLSLKEPYAPSKKRRCVRVEKPADVQIKDLVLLVGSEVLEGTAGVRVQHVALPTQFILHSNVAVGMMLQAFASGQLEGLSQVTFAESCNITCIHFEGDFWNFPKSSSADAHVNRLDNINAVLRQFGVDMHATYTVTGERVRTNFNPMLSNFIAVGQYTPKGRCCFHIDPTLFAASLAV